MKSSPLVSVITPTYNHACFLAETIQSVLDQSYANFEFIIVNDGSTDDTKAVVAGFTDPRIKYIEQENCGATAARNTGIRASTGAYIALLDADDLWHPDKLHFHVEHLAGDPAVGATYNARFELNGSAATVRTLWSAPRQVTLADLVLGFPFSPSDLVLRREWVFQVGLFDEQYAFYGDDLDFFCRLALAGCRFARIEQALNYRRRHSGRVIKNLAECVEAAIQPLDDIFADPRCPEEVLELHDQAFATQFQAWALIAFGQEETMLAQELIRKVMDLRPQNFVGAPCPFAEALVHFAISDEAVDHETVVCRVFSQLPTKLAPLQTQQEWVIARGYLEMGVRAIMWDRPEAGRISFELAAEKKGRVDAAFMESIAHQLSCYGAEFGFPAAQKVLNNLLEHLRSVSKPAERTTLWGNYHYYQVFESHLRQRYADILRCAPRAIRYAPSRLRNRGFSSILLKAVSGMIRSAMP